ncbi:MAG: tRNA-guanine transglycosylase DpdA [Candidatus Poribacteria bacterium]|nr:tRNA-guanine transglycosylase DpdA [Candidatus Poribacteria bacterium]
MLKFSQPNSQESAAGHLLILGCSDKCIENFNQAPALEVYDGPNYRVLRKFLRENGWPPGLMIKIISAKCGIIDATTLIKPYDERLDKETAKKMHPKVRDCLGSIGLPASVFINLNKDSLPAISCITTLFRRDTITESEGRGGEKLAAMKKWLHDLPNHTATVPSQKSNVHPLYFFPDWDDYVYEPFQTEETREDRRSDRRRYAHEIFGAKTPYDGLLFSLAQLQSGKGPLSRLKKKGTFDLQGDRRMPENMLLFGDPGAFSYIADSEPPITSEEAAYLYDKFGFNLGASVDHIPIPSITPEKRKERMDLTEKNAEQFLKICKGNKYQFVPVGSIQGVTIDDYVCYARRYIEMGYRCIALGGLVRRKDSEILKIVAAVREILQKHTRGIKENIWVHLFGVLRPDLQSSFQNLGVSSFDSASYLRKAWMSSDRNYLAPDGKGWYGTIRVPMSTSKAMRDAAKSQSISTEQLEELESQCLSNLDDFDGTPELKKKVLDSVDEYGPLLQRKGEGNHFKDEHEKLMSDQPWKKCKCPVCKNLGIQVVVFRGANRNRRRGFHNTWVFYHKLLHEKN